MIPKDAERRRLFLMRHGSVSYFDAAGRPYRPDTVSLNAQGRAEADAAGTLFAQARLHFDRVIVSGLARTTETAARVLAHANHPLHPEVEPNWREIEGGKLAEISPARLRESFTSPFQGVAREDTRFLEGETIGGLFDRVIPPLEALRAADNWDVALLILHGGVNIALLSYLLTGQRQFLGGLAQAPAGISVLDLGANPSDVVLRASNLAPTDWLHTSTRKTTMELLFDQYAKFRLSNPLTSDHD